MVKLGDWLSEGWEIVKDDMATFAIASFLAMLISGVTLGICAGPMSVGLFMMVHDKLRGEDIAIGDVFKGFQKFGPSFLVIVIVAIASSVVGFLLGLTGVGSVLMPFVGIAIGGAMFFTFQIIAESDMGGIDAMKMSWEKVKDDFLMFCVAYLVYSLIAQLGVIACVVGIFITTPVMMAAMGVAYRDIFGLSGAPEAAPAAAPAAPAAPEAPTAEAPKAEAPAEDVEVPDESGWEEPAEEETAEAPEAPEAEESSDEDDDSDWST
jgi:hypothetical protein